MYRRLTGCHRLRPSLSYAARAKRDIERLNRLIDAARQAGDEGRIVELENQKHWAVINSLRS
jgi:hypothetical protein